MDRKTLSYCKRLAACTRLSTTVSQLFEPQLHKNRHFYVLRPSFNVCPGDALWQSRKTLHKWKDNSVLAKPLAACTHLSSTISQLFEPQVEKIAVFTYRSPHFCFPWRHLCDYHAICCMDGKTIRCLPNPSQHVSICLQQFPSYTMLKSMRKFKNRYFCHIFVSPEDAPGAITLNVVWMEKAFDSYKLSCWMCPSNYNRFSDRARYWSKIVIFSYPPCIRCPR